MRWAHRLALMAIPAVCLLAGSILPGPGPRTRPAGEPGSTVEPTLPLVIDLRLPGEENRGPGGDVRLEVVLEAGDAIDRLTLALHLPEGIRALDLPEAAAGEPLALDAGERRAYQVPLVAAREGRFPLRVEAAFTLPDGRVFRTRQGAILTVGAPPPIGRSNAGALEFMGVPLEALDR
jgi:hypothetical protein